ncbi:MAG: hypothetical protein ACOYLQ_09600 [Hyphomicrobiaceae bacterium]
MADQPPVVHIGENSPEQVAYKMTQHILYSLEKKTHDNTSRDEFLDTYAECIKAVRGFRVKPAGRSQFER